MENNDFTSQDKGHSYAMFKISEGGELKDMGPELDLILNDPGLKEDIRLQIDSARNGTCSLLVRRNRELFEKRAEQLGLGLHKKQ